MPLAANAAETTDELTDVRHACIEAARRVQAHVQKAAALQRDMDLRARAASGAERGLTETKAEQSRFLGIVLSVAQQPTGSTMAVKESPLDRIRSEMLLQATLPGLRTEGHALATEVQRLANLRRDIAVEAEELKTEREALDKDRSELGSLETKRRELVQKALPEDKDADSRVARLAKDAKDLDDLIKRADSAADRRDGDILVRARKGLAKAAAAALTAETADPTRPHELHKFDPQDRTLAPPVLGPVVRVFDSTEADGELRNAAGLSAVPGALVVAPFDGRVIFAGSFRDLGPILIIRHAGGYHSTLAKLGRADVRIDDWVLTGEPVGTMPEGSDKKPGETVLNFEIRQAGQAVDPQPWLAVGSGQSSGPDTGTGVKRKGTE